MRKMRKMKNSTQDRLKKSIPDPVKVIKRIGKTALKNSKDIQNLVDINMKLNTRIEVLIIRIENLEGRNI